MLLNCCVFWTHPLITRTRTDILVNTRFNEIVFWTQMTTRETDGTFKRLNLRLHFSSYRLILNFFEFNKRISQLLEKSALRGKMIIAGLPWVLSKIKCSLTTISKLPEHYTHLLRSAAYLLKRFWFFFHTYNFELRILL